MLGNYLTTALRLLWRERGYAAINIFGLAIGLALCLLLVQFVAYQLAVGDLHKKKDRVYRVLGPSSMSTREYRVHGDSPNRAGADPQGATARSRGGGPLCLACAVAT